MDFKVTLICLTIVSNKFDFQSIILLFFIIFWFIFNFNYNRNQMRYSLRETIITFIYLLILINFFKKFQIIGKQIEF